jgi:LPS O-antigen subunit length determinant protein (WzzB/FepE family)
MTDIEQNPPEGWTAKKSGDGEIFLIDLFVVIWRRRVMIIAIIFIAAAGTAAFFVVFLVLSPEISPFSKRSIPSTAIIINASS